ncbi:NTF2-like protein [Lactarius akahatsu]|uniref:NTF2-like protein n=1 Tax=Lactarius akahatsu TaxID=416441 RepID=A0AAD4QFL0_9AGAM|nr:NTF2-like protein [Lactarius akahatsu]
MIQASSHSGPSALVNTALRNAGLMDRDERMRDASDKPGGRKGFPKPRSHRPRLIDTIKGQPGPSRNPTLATRIASPSSGPLAIRGAAVGRVRRNAISLNGDKVLPGTRVTVGKPLEVWRRFVQQRWDPQSRFLNLERMSEDEMVSRAGLLPPGIPGSTGKEAAVIFKLASQLKPPVRTISLANNNLQTTHVISTIAHYLPNLANLSLENNNLRVWKDIDSISQLSDKKDKLLKLRELILIGNPIRELEYQSNRVDTYRNNIMRRFPTLEILDKEPVTKISFDAPQISHSTGSTGSLKGAKEFPALMRPPLVAGVDGGIITSFFARFFPLFDTQRATLSNVYHEFATFSFQANTSIPVRAKIQGFQHSKEMPNQRNLDWSPWLGAGSRNLSRVGGAVDKMLKSIHVGREKVLNALTTLPRTKHDIAGAAEKFCIDAWPVTQEDRTTLFLSIHGQFVEESVGGVRSFDRSFVLTPAPEGSRAKASGWDVEVLSDQLVIRAYSSHEAWTPGPLFVQATSSGNQTSSASSTASIHQELGAIPEPQRSLVTQVCKLTRLNVRFAVDCLQNNGWDVDRAVANFEQVKGTLGQDAFL